MFSRKLVQGAIGSTRIRGFHGIGRDAVGDPVQRPLGDVVVKEGEYGDQLILCGDDSERVEDVGLVN